MKLKELKNKMKLVFSDQALPTQVQKTIFLAGPSPRTNKESDWRHDALSALNTIGYDGHVLIPIPSIKFDGGEDGPEWNYDNQIEWECNARKMADVIVFWVDRNIKGNMPGFTTNIEFGEDLHSGKILYGRPQGSDKNRYLDKRIQMKGMPIYDNLTLLLMAAQNALGDGAYRVGGEVDVPLFIWKTTQFQNWYKQMLGCGNRIEGAELLHHFSPNGKFIFSFVLKVNVWIDSEGRFKSNEFIFSRTDVSSVVAFYKENVLLIKEFRSPVRNAYGMVYELPGGSSKDSGIEAQVTARNEFEEETGVLIEDPKRFEKVSSRQLLATLSTHTSTLYRLALTQQEYEAIKANEGEAFGVEEDTEITYPHFTTINTLMMDAAVDFSTVGMIASALHGVK